MTEEGRKNDQKILEEIRQMNSKFDLGEKIHHLELELASIALFVKTDQERYTRLITDQKVLFDKIDRWLFVGDGDKPSFSTKVDRLEQNHIRTEALINWGMVIIGSVITGIILFLILGHKG